jgi:hypothetical protein
MNRTCGSCTLCCKLVPVEQLGKRAGERCRYQSHKGCRIYATLGTISPECRLWSCQWLVDPETLGLGRPDRSHYVVDIMPDFIGAHDPDTGRVEDVQVMQVWVDPDYPEAWRDPALLRYIEHVAVTRQQATLIRFNSADALAVFAPAIMADGEWHEKRSGQPPDGSVWRNPMAPIHDRTARIAQDAATRRRDGGTG